MSTVAADPAKGLKWWVIEWWDAQGRLPVPVPTIMRACTPEGAVARAEAELHRRGLPALTHGLRGRALPIAEEVDA